MEQAKQCRWSSASGLQVSPLVRLEQAGSLTFVLLGQIPEQGAARLPPPAHPPSLQPLLPRAPPGPVHEWFRGMP